MLAKILLDGAETSFFFKGQLVVISVESQIENEITSLIYFYMDHYPLHFFGALLRKSNTLALGWEHYTVLKYRFLSSFQKVLIITNTILGNEYSYLQGFPCPEQRAGWRQHSFKARTGWRQ